MLGEARIVGPEAEFKSRRRQPGVDQCFGIGLCRHPALAAELARQPHQNRLRIPQHHCAVGQHGQLSKRIEREELRRLMVAREEVDGMLLIRHP